MTSLPTTPTNPDHSICEHYESESRFGQIEYGLNYPPPRRICNRRCLFVCLLATLHKNFPTDLHDILREGWQWANEQMIRFWWRSGSGKTCLCGCMHCPSASSFALNRTEFRHWRLIRVHNISCNYVKV